MSTSSDGWLSELCRRWRAHYQELRAGVRVLVVDDEPIVSEVVGQILALSGLRFDVAVNAEEAWARIHQGGYSLLITDKNLPGQSGIELVARVRAAGLDLPSLVITGYASVESIADALAAGAADYLTKPFENIEQVQRRVSAVLERSLLSQLYSRMVRDLTGAVSLAAGQDAVRSRIGPELFGFKRSLAARADLLWVMPRAAGGAALAEHLRAAGVALQPEEDGEAAVAAVVNGTGPVAAAVSLQLPFPVSLISELRRHDPLLAVIAITASPRLADSLQAVEAGIADFFIPAVERPEALLARVRRLVGRSRRDRLYLELLAILHREATREGQPPDDSLLALLPEDHREYLVRATALANAEAPEIEIDLAGLFDGSDSTLPGERRRHERSDASRLEAWYRPAGTSTAFARARLRDISRGGFFLYASEIPDKGTELETHLLLDGEGPDRALRVRGRVVRCERFDPDPEALSGIGVLLEEACQESLDPLLLRLRDAGGRG